MKLLHAVIRSCVAHVYAAPHRGLQVPHDFRATVPASLAKHAAANTEPVAAAATASIHTRSSHPLALALVTPAASQHLRQLSSV